MGETRSFRKKQRNQNTVEWFKTTRIMIFKAVENIGCMTIQELLSDKSSDFKNAHASDSAKMIVSEASHNGLHFAPEKCIASVRY